MSSEAKHGYRSSQWLLGLLIGSAIVVAMFRSGLFYHIWSIYPEQRSADASSTSDINWVTFRIDCLHEESRIADFYSLLHVGETNVDEVLSMLERCENGMKSHRLDPSYEGVLALVSPKRKELPTLVFSDGVLSEIVQK